MLANVKRRLEKTTIYWFVGLRDQRASMRKLNSSFSVFYLRCKSLMTIAQNCWIKGNLTRRTRSFCQSDVVFIAHAGPPPARRLRRPALTAINKKRSPELILRRRRRRHDARASARRNEEKFWEILKREHFCLRNNYVARRDGRGEAGRGGAGRPSTPSNVDDHNLFLISDETDAAAGINQMKIDY
ncbi:hypothetical protein EVAR_19547_1 [Eumeta japonica]|uniref:Uncharacterized protein n=1 Tax=Eumeta variegata TaxID=151549 RepID=A0A4C1UG22_EUMVA|nr:hypothetical protein EVAR_19547_1 [Eumeta japonica]